MAANQTCISSNSFGRSIIYSDETEINENNICAVLNAAIPEFDKNSQQIDYLYQYYKGNQPILGRIKDVRPEINNKIVENRANEIVSFKVGYLMGEPIQYVARKESCVEKINTLNDYVFAEDKAAKDKELADWFTICGTSYRLTIPNKRHEKGNGEAPFEIFTLDPRHSFIIYNNGLGNKPLMGVIRTIKKDGTSKYWCCTDNKYYTIEGDNVTSESYLGGIIPMVEYPLNSARIGAFEIVLPLLDALNKIGSDRVNGIESFIQALFVLKGADLEEDIDTIKEKGGILLPADGEVKYLTQELNQAQTQTLVDYYYQTILTICGMPNRNGGSSTSDTGSAVIMRDGWSAAEARAKDTELMFKKSEKQFLKLAITFSNELEGMDLNLSDIEIRFTRRNYENIQEKVNVLTQMLDNEKIHPKLAFETSGAFVDPDLAYTTSSKYAEKKKNETAAELEKFHEIQVQQAKNAVTENGGSGEQKDDVA